MDEEGKLLSRLTQAPEDDAARLVYADWLEERGDARAAFLRFQTGGRLLTPQEWLHSLHSPTWLAQVDKTEIENCQEVQLVFRCPKRWSGPR